MAKSGFQAATALRPQSARIGDSAARSSSSPPLRQNRRRRDIEARDPWRRGFLRAFAAGGLEAALSGCGKDLGDAVLACLDDPAFREELERISLGRLEAAEHKLVDLLLRRLDGPDDSIEKSALSIWQLLRDDRRKTGAAVEGPKAPVRKARHTIPPERQAAGRRAAERAREFEQLLEVIRARLAKAEEKKALAGAGGYGSSISSSRTKS